jgi:hypothetical protein
MSKLISKLPEDVRVVALQRQREEAKDWDKNTDLLSIAFHFSKTPEDAGIWWNVYYGNYTPFREFHAKQKQQDNDDFIQWLENKIELCLNDKDLQREHWAFCQCLKKYRELQPLPEPPKN